MQKSVNPGRLAVILMALYGLAACSDNKEPDQDAGTRTMLQTLASSVNRQAPVRVSPNLRVDGAEAHSNRITYLYTFFPDQEMPELNVPREATVAGLCQAPDQQAVLQQGVSIRFEYRDESGKVLTQLDVDQSQC